MSPDDQLRTLIARVDEYRACEAPTPGAWMTTATGRHMYFNATNPHLVCLDDIAHHLSMLCRFTGATSRFYSVAEHSVHVMMCATELACAERRPIGDIARAALLHDAHEAYIGDLSSPLKRAIGPGIRTVDKAMTALVRERFGISDDPVIHTIVHNADLLVLHAEARAFLPPGCEAWAMSPWEKFRPFGWWRRRKGGRATFLECCKAWGIK